MVPLVLISLHHSIAGKSLGIEHRMANLRLPSGDEQYEQLPILSSPWQSQLLINFSLILLFFSRLLAEGINSEHEQHFLDFGAIYIKNVGKVSD